MCSDLKPGALAGLSWVKRSPRPANRTSVLFLVPRRRMKCHFRRSSELFLLPSRRACPCRRLPLSARNRRAKERGPRRSDLQQGGGGGGRNQTILGATSGNAYACVYRNLYVSKHRFENTEVGGNTVCPVVDGGRWGFLWSMNDILENMCASRSCGHKRSFGIRFGGNLTDLVILIISPGLRSE